MCGIVGALSIRENGFSYDEVKAFTTMLFLDTERGWDSTGVFSVSNDNNVSILKDAVHGPDFIRTKQYKEFTSDAFTSARFLVGHNRAATRGSVNPKNAHPFWVNDNTVLVQNGTWFGDHKHIKNTDVDTEAVAHILDENQEDIEEGLNKINAAYALVWYNVAKKTLYAIRNSQRPLGILYLKNGTILLASEISTMLYAAAKNKLELEDKPYELKEDTLNMWTINDKNKIEFSSQEIKSKPLVYTPTRHPYYNYEEEPKNKVLQLPNPGSRIHPEDYQGVVTYPNDVRKTIADYMEEGSFMDWELSIQTAEKLIAENKDKKDTETIVEWVDYLNANRHNKCTAWHLIGKTLSTNDEEANVLYHVVDFSMTEAEMMDKIGKFAKVRLGEFYRRYHNRAAKYVVTNLVKVIEEIDPFVKRDDQIN